jgi:hypothetical protein
MTVPICEIFERLEAKNSTGLIGLKCEISGQLGVAADAQYSIQLAVAGD